MRPIDAVAYRKVLEEEKDYQLEHCFDSLKIRMGLEIAIADLEDMPTVDAVPVVRCKECKYSFRLTDQDGNRKLLCTEIGKRGLAEDDFCSYGKRRGNCD